MVDGRPRGLRWVFVLPDCEEQELPASLVVVAPVQIEQPQIFCVQVFKREMSVGSSRQRYWNLTTSVHLKMAAI